MNADRAKSIPIEKKGMLVHETKDDDGNCRNEMTFARFFLKNLERCLQCKMTLLMVMISFSFSSLTFHFCFRFISLFFACLQRKIQDVLLMVKMKEIQLTRSLAFFSLSFVFILVRIDSLLSSFFFSSSFDMYLCLCSVCLFDLIKKHKKTQNVQIDLRG